jgi:peptidoglycan/LPS O-acetylase OafA/YrhL
MSTSPSGDRIYGFTKFVAALLGLVVFFAFVVLYFFPTQTKQLFAWPIQPPLTAMFIGASYINGVIFFSAVLLGKKWHHVWAPHIGVFVFATLLLIATILHWDKFSHAHPVFWVWVFIYVVAPVLVAAAFLRNRREDPKTPDIVDAEVPLALRVVWLIPGIIFLGAALYGFINPAAVIPHWPWKATPLTMRVMMAFYSMLGVAVLAVLREPRWSAWRIGLIGVIAWHALVIIAAFLRQGDFKGGMFHGWWFPFEAVLLAAAVITFLVMELRAARSPAIA